MFFVPKGKSPPSIPTPLLARMMKHQASDERAEKRALYLCAMYRWHPALATTSLARLRRVYIPLFGLLTLIFLPFIVLWMAVRDVVRCAVLLVCHYIAMCRVAAEHLSLYAQLAEAERVCDTRIPDYMAAELKAERGKALAAMKEAARAD